MAWGLRLADRILEKSGIESLIEMSPDGDV